ncbi:MAG: Cupin 2 conserved barrel domain protein [Betaproteobacteria bacterium]|nr:Cupin 2 conserved barrel domain protein [Betaproteobacteria bacterium]
MQRAEFESAIRGEGFAEIIGKTAPPDFEAKPHTHPWDVRILVLEGQMTVVKQGVPHVCNPGDTFSMDAHCEHFEKYGAAGSTYVLGRREVAPTAA